MTTKLTLREVSIKELRLPGDFMKRIDQPHVKELAKSIQAHGPIHHPVVQKKSWRVVCGLDRVAAHLLLGREFITVDMREMSDSQADALEEEENVRRRHGAEEERRRVLARVEQAERHFARRTATGENAELVKGRPRSAKGLAREKVAAERGVTPEAIRKAQYREKKARTREGKQERQDGPPLNTMGIELDPDWLRNVRRVQTQVDDARFAVQRAQGALTRLESLGLPFPPGLLQRLKVETHDTAAMLRQARPDSLCPWCKGHDPVQGQCVPCVATGWVSAAKAKEAPPELLSVEAPMVVHEGKLRPLGDFQAATLGDGTVVEEASPEPEQLTMEEQYQEADEMTAWPIAGPNAVVRPSAEDWSVLEPPALADDDPFGLGE